MLARSKIYAIFLGIFCMSNILGASEEPLDPMAQESVSEETEEETSRVFPRQGEGAHNESLKKDCIGCVSTVGAGLYFCYRILASPFQCCCLPPILVGRVALGLGLEQTGHNADENCLFKTYNCLTLPICIDCIEDLCRPWR